MKKMTLVILIMGLLLITVGCSNSTEESNEVEESGAESKALAFQDEYLVDKEWLNDALENQELLILDARGAEAYNKGHIPGAIATSWQSLSAMQSSPGDMSWGVVKEADELSLNIASLGIDKSKKVIVYTDAINGWGEDGRIYWTFRMAGLDNVRILDGGYNLWVDSGLEVSKDVPKAGKSEFEVKDLDKSASIDFNTLKDNYEEYVLIDTRDIDEYNGATKYGEARGGHLPGAKHFYFRNVLNEDGTYKEKEALEDLFKAAGLQKEDKIVTYCTAGIRSAHLQIALEMAGYENVMNYDASFYEWAGNDEVSVEK